MNHVPPTKGQPAPHQPDPEKKGPGWSQVKWITVAWYVILTLAMLWFWQETSKSIAFRTIPYSTFKQYLAKGEVVQCTVSTDEIDGKINTAPCPVGACGGNAEDERCHHTEARCGNAAGQDSEP